MTTTERILQYIDYKGISKYKFCKNLEVSGAFLDKPREITTDKYANILVQYPEINPEWLLTGEGSMLKDEKAEKQEKQKNLIPLYDDVATIGGTSSVAELSGNSKPTEYIDAGDWFTNVTAAIRHYGDSMVEYPNGCILALRAINDINSIVWGRTYV
ncbi:peptidase S24, partial [Ornithobacterium rhinotracheale]